MIIKNARIITCDDKQTIIENGWVKVNDEGRIQKVGITPDLPYQTSAKEEVIDAEQKYLMPGGICAHTHFYSAFSRGMYIPGEAPDAFPKILENLWWKLDKSLNADAVYYSALVCLVDAIIHGTTTLFDHHASPNFISMSLDKIYDAAERSGLRVSTCYEVTDRDGKEKAMEGIDENLRFIDRIQSEINNQQSIRATFGLHASLTLTDETIKAAVKKCPSEIGFHIHAAEHNIDEYDSLNKYGMRVVERLHALGILKPNSILAHGVHIDTNETNLLVESNSWLSHQPRSNMNNAVGLPNIESQLNAGVNLCLGNDGFSNSMWQEWKAAYLAHKLYSNDPRKMQADKIYTMAIENNRALVEDQFNGLKTGQISEGYQADLILVDYQPFTELTKDNFPWHLVFGFRDGMVTDTIVNGKFLMRDQSITTINVEDVNKEAKAISKIVWEKYHGYF